MTQSFILTQEAILAIQDWVVEMLERCLNDANAQDEAKAKAIKLTNSTRITDDEMTQELSNFRQKLDRLIKLLEKMREKAENGEMATLLFVKFNFLLKETLEIYCKLIVSKNTKIHIGNIIVASTALYKTLKNKVTPETPKSDENYIILDCLKHIIQSVIKTGLRVNAFSEEEIKALDLGDITPQESETMLTFLSSMKQWESVYKNLAVS